LMPIAMANLRAKGPPFKSIGPGAWAAATGDFYDSSRRLLLDEIRALGLSGDPVALVPNRDLVLLAGSRDAEALLAIARRPAPRPGRAGTERGPIHRIALCVKGDGWSECVPNVTPAVRDRYRDLTVEGWSSLYNDQQQSLQDELGNGWYVGKSEVVQSRATKH